MIKRDAVKGLNIYRAEPESGGKNYTSSILSASGFSGNSVYSISLSGMILLLFFSLTVAKGCGECGVTGFVCNKDEDCPEGYVCEDGGCLIPGEECTDDNQCPIGWICDPVDSVCVPGQGQGCTVICFPGSMRCSDNKLEECSANGCSWVVTEECGEDRLCHRDTCCSSEDICGDACCTGEEICFANACIIPGNECMTHSDCLENQMCESSLGSSENEEPGGGQDPDRVCPGAAPIPGRCIDLPPRCSDPDADPETCIRDDCEYRPETGPVNAVVEWQWGQNGAESFPDAVDVWSTPAVGRIYDTNCDGRIDHLDPPAIVFVSANVNNVQCAADNAENCKKGVLRALDGQTGTELWALEVPEEGSMGFAGVSVAIGDITLDGRMDIVTASGEGYIFIVDGDGNVLRKSDEPIEGAEHRAFGWGSGFYIGDMDGDGYPEIAYADQVFTTRDGNLTRLFVGGEGVGSSMGGAINARRRAALSIMADLNGDGFQELLAGRTAYRIDGSFLWNREDIGDGFPAVADLNGNGLPEVVLISDGKILILDGATGNTLLGPEDLPGSGRGGAPTVADFTGDGGREIGVATQNFYSVFVPDFSEGELRVLWSSPAHDFSSSVTGSTVFDFEGDGRAEVIYNDECYLWVYDGPTGDVKFLGYTSSFTATEATMVSDVTGDGRANILLIHNGVDMERWHCAHHTGEEDDPWPEWIPPEAHPHYRGITIFRDADNSWVGTRSLWNQHAYHVTNICSDRDSACDPPRPYGAIPESPLNNWDLSWLNNFRQNIQETGLFDAPDAVVSLRAECTVPIRLRAAVRNRGPAILPAGVEVGFYARREGSDILLGEAIGDTALFPGQVMEILFEVPEGSATMDDYFVAKVLGGPFRECDVDNNESEAVIPICIG